MTDRNAVAEALEELTRFADAATDAPGTGNQAPWHQKSGGTGKSGSVVKPGTAVGSGHSNSTRGRRSHLQDQVDQLKTLIRKGADRSKICRVLTAILTTVVATNRPDTAIAVAAIGALAAEFACGGTVPTPDIADRAPD